MSTNDIPLLSQQEPATTTNEPVLSLLFTLPDGVESILLSFVGTGVGGLKGLLNLREVCKTTKSWVDHLPERQGVSIFSRAQVRIDSDVETRRRFLESAPPFAVTSLSLNIACVGESNRLPDEKELWNRFYAFWASRLETLQLRNDAGPTKKINSSGGYGEHAKLQWNAKDLKRRSLTLLEAPKLRNVSSCLFCIDSSCFLVHSSILRGTGSEEKVFSLQQAISRSLGELKKLLYSNLEKNQNLKRIEIFFVIPHVSELERLGKVIDAKKEDEELDISLGIFGFPLKRNTVDFEESNVAFIKFSKIVVASKSKIRLRLHCDPIEHERDCLQTAKGLLGGEIFWEFANRVESIHSWKPTENSLALLQDLPMLERLEKLDLGANRIAELIFPPNLVELGLQSGFPTVRGLPAILTTLKLHEVSCCATDLMTALRLLNGQCPSLEKLLINWCSEEEPSSTSTTATAGPEASKFFQKLRVLFLTGYINEGDGGACRDVLLNGLNVDHLHLFDLSLKFAKRTDDLNNIRIPSREVDVEEFPVIDEDLLTRVCEGRVGSSLVYARISKKSVAPDGLPVLEKLESLVSENRKARKEREGRGEWEHRLGQGFMSISSSVLM